MPSVNNLKALPFTRKLSHQLIDLYYARGTRAPLSFSIKTVLFNLTLIYIYLISSISHYSILEYTAKYTLFNIFPVPSPNSGGYRIPESSLGEDFIFLSR